MRVEHRVGAEDERGLTFYDKRKGLLPAEDLHDWGACAYCGFRGEYPALRRTIIVSTHAPGRVCADMMACIRRRQGRRAA